MTSGTDSLTQQPRPEELADAVYQACQDWSNGTARSAQSQSFRVGISDIGFCSERTRRLIARIPPVDTPDVRKAFLGTAIGSDVEDAVVAAFPGVRAQGEVSVVVPGDAGRSYRLGGHPDLIFGWGVADIKTLDGLELIKKTGPSFQQLFQRHSYTKGAFEAGLLAVSSLDEAFTANIWVDRSGDTPEFYVDYSPYDENVLVQGGMWLDDVVYAAQHDEEARKEPPREMCAVVCGHFADCRAFDTDVSGLITDPTYIAAVRMNQEATDLARTAKRMKDQAKIALNGVNGIVLSHSEIEPDLMVRWTEVGSSTFTVNREPYMKLQISKAPKPKALKAPSQTV